MNFLCAENGMGTSQIVIYVILIVALVFILVMPLFTQRKQKKQFETMLSAIRVGDIVRTAGGVIGRVTKITDKGQIKTVVLETGSKTDKSYMEFDLTAINCVLKSSKVEASDEELSVKEPEVEAKTEEVKEEPKTEETVETKAEETKAEEKPKKKRSSVSKKKSN